ncbi:MAG: hypothetical protein CL920_29360 [Deltaproteobacteria bacterium]|nr:hypothetical protein [Deltaproteobacteria bacterium]MBU52820.1 hypothetical protein [Deltaproteobacteria bacterium]
MGLISFKLVKTIPDTVYLAKMGYPKYKGRHRGSPVEAAFSHQGRYAWISNYKTFGHGFPRAARDKCNPNQRLDNSFVYKVDTQSLSITHAIMVGAVPKYVAVTPDQKYVLVTNWCSWDVSIIDVNTHREIKRVPVGRYPRGIAISPDSSYAYIAVMGTYHIARLDLKTYKLRWWRHIGRLPRHLNISPGGRYLYASFSGEQRVAKIDINSGKVIKKVRTGRAPRSMIISKDGRFLYVVNYFGPSVTQIRTADMKVLHTHKTRPRPIGITYDDQTHHVWVASYRGSLEVFKSNEKIAPSKRRKRRKR